MKIPAIAALLLLSLPVAAADYIPAGQWGVRLEACLKKDHARCTVTYLPVDDDNGLIANTQIQCQYGMKDALGLWVSLHPDEYWTDASCVQGDGKL